MISPQYFAGMMDCDGHFSWRGGRYASLNLGVTSVSPELLNPLRKQFGGNTSVQRKVCSLDCLETHIHRRRIISKWHVTGYKAYLICLKIIPYLLIKVNKAKELLVMYDRAMDNMNCPARRQFHINSELNSWKEKFINTEWEL